MSALIQIPSRNAELSPTELEPASKILAANTMAQSISFCLERKYLQTLQPDDLFWLDACASTAGMQTPYWLKIEQVGRPLSNRAEDTFTAIQKVLQSCHIPQKAQLLFLLNSNKGVVSLYLGIRPIDKNAVTADFTEGLANYIKGLWPGLSIRDVRNNELQALSTTMTKGNERYRSFKTLTGIPSISSQYQTLYPATIDKLIAGMNGKNYTYLVVASPLCTNSVDQMLYKCRDMQGQAESIKSFSFSESRDYNKSWSRGLNEDTSTTKRNWIVGATVGLALLSPVFPVAGALANAALSANKSIKQLTGVQLLTGFMPENKKGTTQTTGESFSESQGKSISQNMINKQIEAAAQQLEHHAQRLETGKAIGCWSVGVYLMGQFEEDMQTATLQLRSILSGQDSHYEPIRIHDITSTIQPILDKSLAVFEEPRITINLSNQTFEHPLGEDYHQLRTVLTTKELSYLINFPIQAVPGISVVDSSPDFSLNRQNNINGLNMGHLLWGGSSTELGIRLPLDTLCRHALVCGVNGSGKTNTVLSVLDGFMKEGCPFLVIEPAKTEYVDWAIEYNKKHPKTPIRIFIPGCENYAKGNYRPEKLRLNPFEVIRVDNSEYRVISHIDRLKATFASAFPMQDILPVVMEHLLYDLYENSHLLEGPSQGKPNATFPQLADVNRQFIDNLMQNLGYAKENSLNISAALRTRFNSLKYGWKGEMLNNKRLSGLSWKDLYGAPTIINLSYAGDDQDRAFIMSLLLQFLYEYRIAESESCNYSFNDNKCRHLVVVEEAHRVMARCDNPELPQFKSGQMFSNFLSEVRAYGQGMMVVDQIPSRLIEDAIKNTNVKIIHKLVAADDSKLIAECIGLSDEQQKVIPKLSIGQAVLAGFNSANVASSDNAAIYLAQINKMK